MKVIAFNGSARKDGNTATLLNAVIAKLETEGIETELYPLSGKKIHGCVACYKCFEKKTGNAPWIKIQQMNALKKCSQPTGFCWDRYRYYRRISDFFQNKKLVFLKDIRVFF